MAEEKFKFIRDFLDNFGDATINGTVNEHESGKTTWLFGRSEDCDFVYSAPKASRRHFQIELCDGHYYIQDLGSTNGTYVNSKEVGIYGMPFSPGDIISIGDTKLRAEAY